MSEPGAAETGRSDRWAWLVLIGAGLIAAALILRLNRDTTFFVDELTWFSDLGGDLGLSTVLEPHNGHLHGTTRLAYLISLELFGTDYVVIRVLAVLALLLASGLFFALARHRVGAAAALAPAILLLFYGSAWQHVAVPIGFTVVVSVAAGLAAFLALEHEGRRADLLACLALCVSLFSFSAGIAFVVGAGVAVLLRSDRLRRLWIVALPIALYAVWWLWALRFDEGRGSLTNAVEIPATIAESLAVTTGAITGANVPFNDFSGLESFFASASALGWIVAGLFVIAVLLRIRMGNVPRSLWASLAVPLTYWAGIGLADGPFAEPDAVRYVFPGTVGILLVATDAARGLRIGRLALATFAAIAIFSLIVNLDYLRTGADGFRSYSRSALGGLAAFELAAGRTPGAQRANGGGSPSEPEASFGKLLVFPPDPNDYLSAASRYGSPAPDLGELRAAAPSERAAADAGLVSLLGLEAAVTPAGGDDCEEISAPLAGPLSIELPAGGALIQTSGSEASEIQLRRFGDSFTPPIGSAEPGEWVRIEIATDTAPDPWVARLSPGAETTVCAFQ
jgi:hypothetical protein